MNWRTSCYVPLVVVRWVVVRWVVINTTMRPQCQPTQDRFFVTPGVKKCIKAARSVYELFGEGDQFRVVYPDGEYDFHNAQRQAAYDFFDEVL